MRVTSLVPCLAELSGQPRTLAALLVHRVLDKGESLGSALGPQLAQLADPRQRALTQELVFGTLRWSYRLDAILSRLLKKPLRKKDRDLHALLLVGLYQLLVIDIPDHAAVSESVDAVRQLGKDWATGMVNGVLRNARRQSGDLLKAVDSIDSARWSYPGWWIEQLRGDWPEHWQQMLEAGNQRPPMVLRVNTLQADRQAYLQQLQAAGIEAEALPAVETGIQLAEPLSVDALPGFRDGAVSVQDGAAQLAATLLDAQPGQRVLDACAAPGGKTCHILERTPGLDSLLAIDSDPQRLQKIRENFQRLKLNADLQAADAGDPQSWWDGRPFQRILLDAPCSGSGVVRRHPDIKQLRRATDLQALSQQQQQLLEALWPLLASGGMLLYVTCSVFRQENSDILSAFMRQHSDASECPLPQTWGKAQPVGRQLLPGEQGMDGFYFACLTRA